MSDSVVILIAVAAVVVIALVAWMATRRMRRQRLPDRFGPEYERVIDVTGNRRKAEKALEARAERHERLQIRPLDRDRRELFAREWSEAQARFVDEPPAALSSADHLVQQVMAERGYPTGDFDQREEDLSVEHADVLDHYRAAHAIADDNERGVATTEELRQAMVHYRALFSSLLDDTRDRDRAHARSDRRHA